MYRWHKKGNLEVLLLHPGGPFWAKKDDGAWTIPKGEFEDGEDSLTAARREFFEETGSPVSGSFTALSPVKLQSGKIIHAFYVEGDFDTAHITSNLFEIEWPPKSGNRKSFPEIDKAEWFSLEEAAIKISKGQVLLLMELEEHLG